MLNNLLDMLGQYSMVQPGDRVVCAVSGGADSMALLWAFYLLREKLDIRLECAHYNHGLRGEESVRDQKFVEDFCASYQIPFHTQTGAVVTGEKGLEAAARDARYQFLNSLDGKIATAHTADDNAETVLMHLVRGTGLKGLGGIAPVNGKLIRPMLNITRHQVEAFLQEYHLSFVEDSSNNTDAFLRNRLRHHVMPLLKAENPRFAQTISQTAQDLRKDCAVLEGMVEKCGDVQALQNMEEGQRTRALAAFLEDCGVKEPSRRHIALLQKLVFSSNPSAKGSFPGGVVIAREYNRLVKLENGDSGLPVKLQNPGITELPGLGLRIVCASAQQEVNTPAAFTVVPMGEITVRARQAGDALCMQGGTKTLKKRFIDRKIPEAQRAFIPVVADEKGILGVYGFGADVKRTGETGNKVTIIFEDIENAEGV